MNSIVQELQSEALSRSTPLTDLLRKAFVVAKKLKIQEFEKWINQELQGYPDEKSDNIPEYRTIRGAVKVWNPYHGWRPVMFENADMEANLSQRSNHQSIAELEHLVGNHKAGGHFEIAFPGNVAQQIMDAIGLDLQPSLHVSPSALVKLLDAVRNIVLQWALKLEEDGILGQGISFSKEEVAAAARANYTLNYFAGDVVNSQVQQGTTSSKQERK